MRSHENLVWCRGGNPTENHYARWVLRISPDLSIFRPGFRPGLGLGTPFGRSGARHQGRCCAAPGRPRCRLEGRCRSAQWPYFRGSRTRAPYAPRRIAAQLARTGSRARIWPHSSHQRQQATTSERRPQGGAASNFPTSSARSANDAPPSRAVSTCASREALSRISYCRACECANWLTRARSGPASGPRACAWFMVFLVRAGMRAGRVVCLR